MAATLVKRDQTLQPVRPNAGIEAAYRRVLDDLITEMNDSLTYWLRASYRANTPEILAMDKSPARELNDAMAKLAKRWQRRFNLLAPQLAKHFATKVAERSDLGLQASLRKAGFTVKFTMTPAANDILQATIQQNVGLIKSIASEHLSKVQGLVMRSVQAGRDIGGLTKDIEEQFGITRRRAVLIARTQNALATASMNKARALEVGITEAVWLHSHAGRTPRPSHVKANGKKYDIAKGMYLDGEWLQPGQAIGCRCLSKPLIPGLS
jgi:uncharacterized protein with gpF-like domain